MNIEKLGEVSTLSARRIGAIELRKRAIKAEGIWMKLDGWDIENEISLEPIRQAVIEACTNVIISTEMLLAELGVSVQNPEPPAVDTADGWKRAAGMYQMAWDRELGPRRPKSHLIDELVCGTRDLRESLEKAEKAIAYFKGDAKKLK